MPNNIPPRFCLQPSLIQKDRYVIIIPDLGIIIHLTQPADPDSPPAFPKAEPMPVPYDVARDIACRLRPAGMYRLPSIRELHYIFAFRQELNRLLFAHHLPTLDDYLWADDELGAHFAWYMNMRNGYTSTTIKTDTHNFLVVEEFM